MITWGIISALTAFATGPASFLIIRFLLGVAEAGFFPGMILYFTYWYPAEYRGRVISTLFIAQPVANALASIASGAILEMDGVFGVKGWQWVFILEALPAVLLGIVVWMVMTDRPAVADWLAPEERQWLDGRIEEERQSIDRRGHLSLMQGLCDPRVLALSAIYFASVTANYGIVFFMPQIVKGMGLSNVMTGFVASVPYIIGTIGLVAWGYSSDRHRERRWHMIRGIDPRRGGTGDGWLARQLILGADGNVDRDHRHLWLADALAVPHRHGGSRRHRAHQRDRQSRRLSRPVRGRLDQE
jgi:ACS family tartrate transporter-like MFS transporter